MPEALETEERHERRILKQQHTGRKVAWKIVAICAGAGTRQQLCRVRRTWSQAPPIRQSTRPPQTCWTCNQVVDCILICVDAPGSLLPKLPMVMMMAFLRVHT